MAITITHAFVSAKGDGTDATLVRPSNWNASHATSINTSKLVGRSTAGIGAFEEISISALIMSALNSADGIAFLAAIGVGGSTTGDGKITLKTVADTGWVMMDDGTIGSALSGSTTRANADTSALFTLVYNNIIDANAPLFTSVGGATTRAAQGTAATAFAANCRLSLPKQLGRVLTGAGTGVALSARALGSLVGLETTTLVTANLPPYTPAGGVTLNFGGAQYLTFGAGGPAPSIVTSGNGFAPPTPTAGFSGTPQGGTSTPFSIMQPSTAWNIMVKL